MSAAAQALAIVAQSIMTLDRVASRRQLDPPLRTRARQESREQALKGSSPRLAGSPSKPDASDTRCRT
jgi:hypothetical protein